MLFSEFAQLYRLKHNLARMTLWPETFWLERFGQKDALARMAIWTVTLWPETLWPERQFSQRDTLAKVSLFQSALWPKCHQPKWRWPNCLSDQSVWPKCHRPKGHSGQSSFWPKCPGQSVSGQSVIQLLYTTVIIFSAWDKSRGPTVNWSQLDQM